MDVDNFKRINDRLGHDMGDRALRTIASSLERCFSKFLQRRSSPGRNYRLGGKEFATLLLNFTPGEVSETGEALRAGVEALHIPTELGEVISPTISVGIAFLSEKALEDSRVSDLLRRADQALYRAKSSGKNRVDFSL